MKKSVTRLHYRFTAGHAEMMAWWCEDLPLPYPSTSYAWARDTLLQAFEIQALLQFYSVVSFSGKFKLSWSYSTQLVCGGDMRERLQTRGSLLDHSF